MSHRVKLERARLHLDGLNQSLERFRREEPYETTKEQDPNSGEFLVRVAHTKPLPIDEWSVLIGDCLYNLRSSLDHIWFAAVLRHTPSPLSPRLIQFPIRRDRQSYASNAYKLAEASEAARSVVEGLQPYSGATSDDDVARHPLWRLEQLGNIDKHRRFAIVGSLNTYAAFGYDAGSNLDFNSIRFGAEFPFEKDAVVFQGTARDPQAKVKMDPQFTFEICFGEAGIGPHQRVSRLLQSIHDHIRDVVSPALEPLL